MKPIITYKSKNTALVDPARGTNAYVYFDFTVWHKFADAYRAEFCYYYLVDVLDENNEVIGQRKKVIPYLGLSKDVPNAVVAAIASEISSTATSYIDRENEFLAAGALGIIAEDNHYGFGLADYELVVEEESNGS